MNLTLVILAAGLSTRYGTIKQLEAVGPSGEALLDYAIYDAVRAGFSKIVCVLRPDVERAFREHIEQMVGGSTTVEFVMQELDSVPTGLAVPPDRHMPWGTGHALLVAEQAIDDPFAVCNADDFYGASAYRLLADHLRSTTPTDIPQFALVGYWLKDTLSAHGGVSRAICECDDHDLLTSITEVRDIREDEGRIAGISVDSAQYQLSGDETISTGLWGFTPEIFAPLTELFVAFLDWMGNEGGNEFLLSTAVDDLIATNQVSVKVLRTRDLCFGMTFVEDRPTVTHRIAEMIQQGAYPQRLSAEVG